MCNASGTTLVGEGMKAEEYALSAAQLEMLRVPAIDYPMNYVAPEVASACGFKGASTDLETILNVFSSKILERKNSCASCAIGCIYAVKPRTVNVGRLEVRSVAVV